MLGIAAVAPNVALAFGPPPFLGGLPPGLGGPPPGLGVGGGPPLGLPLVLPLALASVVLLDILEPVVLLVSALEDLVAVFNVTCMASKAARSPEHQCVCEL